MKEMGNVGVGRKRLRGPQMKNVGMTHAAAT